MYGLKIPNLYYSVAGLCFGNVHSSAVAGRRRRTRCSALVLILNSILVLNPHVVALGLAIVLAIVCDVVLRQDIDNPYIYILVLAGVLARGVFDLHCYDDDNTSHIAALVLVFDPWHNHPQNRTN